MSKPAGKLMLDGIQTDLLLEVHEEDGAAFLVTCPTCDWKVFPIGDLSGHEPSLRFHVNNCGRISR